MATRACHPFWHEVSQDRGRGWVVTLGGSPDPEQLLGPLPARKPAWYKVGALKIGVGVILSRVLCHAERVAQEDGQGDGNAV